MGSRRKGTPTRLFKSHSKVLNIVTQGSAETQSSLCLVRIHQYCRHGSEGGLKAPWVLKSYSTIFLRFFFTHPKLTFAKSQSDSDPKARSFGIHRVRWSPYKITSFILNSICTELLTSTLCTVQKTLNTQNLLNKQAKQRVQHQGVRPISNRSVY